MSAMKLQQISSNGFYMLGMPKSLVEAKGWKKGDRIRVELDSKGNIVLKKENPA